MSMKRRRLKSNVKGHPFTSQNVKPLQYTTEIDMLECSIFDISLDIHIKVEDS
jgi:hypothetical protein